MATITLILACGLFISLSLYYCDLTKAIRLACQAAESDHGQLVLIVPCHDEVEFAKRMVDYVSATSRVELVLLLTNAGSAPGQGERNERIRACADAADPNTQAVRVMEVPLAVEGKSEKLSFFFEGLLPQHMSGKETFWIADVDSRLHLAAILGSVCQSRGATCFQSPVYIALSRADSLWVSAMSLAHLERSGLEVALIRRREQSNFLRVVPLGMMGASMGFNREALGRILPWPLDSDDIRIGYRADARWIARALVGPWVRCNPCSSIGEWAFQSMRIAYGVGTRAEELRSQPFRWFLSWMFDILPGIRMASSMGIATALALEFGLFAALVCLLTVVAMHCVWLLRCYRLVDVSEPRAGGSRPLVIAALATLFWVPARSLARVASATLSEGSVLRLLRRSTDKVGATR